MQFQDRPLRFEVPNAPLNQARLSLYFRDVKTPTSFSPPPGAAAFPPSYPSIHLTKLKLEPLLVELCNTEQQQQRLCHVVQQHDCAINLERASRLPREPESCDLPSATSQHDSSITRRQDPALVCPAKHRIRLSIAKPGVNSGLC